MPHVLTGVQSAGWDENQQEKVQERKTFGFQMICFEIVLDVSSFHLHLAMNKNSGCFFVFFKGSVYFSGVMHLIPGSWESTQLPSLETIIDLDDLVLKFWGKGFLVSFSFSKTLKK